MKCVVTGAAGFIGSHLCETLLNSGHEVVGLDAFIPYYPRSIKEHNLAGHAGKAGWTFRAADLRQDPLEPLLEGAEVVFHLAAMPGLVKSWTDLEGYWSCNVLATQRLLSAVSRLERPLRRFLFASTSSVYGRYSSGDESLPTRPISPYGITKLAAENFCRAHADEYGLPLVVLRYFSVYGPRQRPDMGYYQFIEALLRDDPVVVFGDGLQVRGNTYVDDCVAATLAAVQAPVGEIYNVGGGEAASVWDILNRLEGLADRKARVLQKTARPGDQRYTLADTTRLKRHCGWQPRTQLAEGLTRQWEWQRQLAVSPLP